MGQPQNIRDLSPRARFLMALGMFFFGGFLLAIVFGWIPSDPSSIHAPLWVLGAVAMVFLLAGVMILLAGNERLTALNNLVIWLFMVCLAAPFNWVAFGEGERRFSGSSSFLGVTSSGATGETEGRIVFGFFAVLMDLLVVVVAWRFLRGRKSR